MRYSIGSISKQFTSVALLLLAEEGKLSLDDRVAKWFPELTRAGDVTVRAAAVDDVRLPGLLAAGT